MARLKAPMYILKRRAEGKSKRSRILSRKLDKQRQNSIVASGAKP